MTNSTVRRLALIIAILLVAVFVGAGVIGVRHLQRLGREQTVGILANARAELKAGRTAEAGDLFQDYLSQRPDDKAVRREFASIVLDELGAGRLRGKTADSGFRLLEQVIRENPADHWVRYQVATWQMQRGQVGSALGHLDELRAALGTAGFLESPDGVVDQEKKPVTRLDIELLAIDGLTKTGQFAEAVNALSRLVGFDPVTRQFDPDAARGAGRPGDAVNSTALFAQLANLLENELNDEEAAGRVVIRNTEVNADDPAAWISLAAWKWYRERNQQAALDAVAKATAIAPDDSAVMHSNFVISRDLNDRGDEAAAIADRGLQLHPTQEWPYVAKASLCLKQRDVRGTLEALQAAVAKLGVRPAILQMLVDLPDAPEWNEVIETVSTTLAPSLAGENPFRKVLEGRLLMAKGKWFEAIAALEAGRSLAQGQNALQVTANLALATCHECLGDTDLQLAAYQRALVENRNSTEARAGVAKALLACGRLDAALPEFRRVANALPVAELAGRPDIWAPLLRLEYSAISRRRPGRRTDKDVEALVASLRREIPAAALPLLDAEQLAGDDRIDEAITALNTARESALGDARLAAAAVALIGRHQRPERIVDVVRVIPAEIRDDPRVMVAIAEAIRALPPDAAGVLTDDLLSRHPHELLAVMTAFDSRLRLGRHDDTAALVEKIATLAGPDSTHAIYAEAAAWVLGTQLEGAKLSTSRKQELPALRERLAGITVQRPSWTELQCLLAEIDVLAGQMREAITRFQQALSFRPSDPEIVTQLATLLIDAGRFNDAEKTLDGLEVADLRRLGRLTAELRLRAGKVAEAVAIASQAVASAEQDPDDLLWFANVLADHGDATAAATAIEHGLSRSPTSSELWLALADLRAAAGDSAAAVTTLEQAVEKVPDDGRPLLLAEVDRRAGRVDAAATAFQELTEQPTADALLLRRAAVFYLDVGLTTDAQAALQRMLTIRPGTSAEQEATRWARRRLTEDRLRDGPFSLAQKAIQELKDNAGGRGTLTPENTDFAARLLAGRPEPRSWRIALEMLEDLERQQALTVSQRVLVARLRERIGDWRRARDDLRALAVKPDMLAEVYVAFVDLLLAHDDRKTAATWIGALVSRSPTAAETIVLQARLALAQGDKPEAVKAAKRLMPDGDVTAGNVSAVLATARTMEDLGFLAAAENLLVRSAAAADAGILAQGGFLLRRNRIDEASEVLDAGRDTLAQDPRFALLEATLCEKRGQWQEAEAIYRRLLDVAEVQCAERVQATARLVLCLLDRDAVKIAYDLADRGVSELGPHPDLLDARGMCGIATGSTSDAVRDLTEAALAPTPERLLHLADAQNLAQRYGEARATLPRAAKLGLDPAVLRPTDRQRLERLERTFGNSFR